MMANTFDIVQLIAFGKKMGEYKATSVFILSAKNKINIVLLLGNRGVSNPHTRHKNQ